MGSNSSSLTAKRVVPLTKTVNEPWLLLVPVPSHRGLKLGATKLLSVCTSGVVPTRVQPLSPVGSVVIQSDR